MNKHSLSLIETAKEITSGFQSNPDVKSIVLTGSAGCGTADDYSDLDILVFRNTVPSEEEFNREKSEALENGGGVHFTPSDDGYSVYKYINGRKCDFAHIPLDSIGKIFNSVHKDFSTDETEHQVVYGFINSVPLYGREWYEEKKKMLVVFPHELAVKMVRNNMGVFHIIWEVENHAIGRNDDILFYELMTKSIKRVINVLCGLNRIYFPGKMKGISHAIKKMKLKPANLESCLSNLYKSDKREVLKEFTYLVEETLSLTEKVMPEIDTTRARNFLYMKLRKDILPLK